jgi:hypothetical protein
MRRVRTLADSHRRGLYDGRRRTAQSVLLRPLEDQQPPALGMVPIKQFNRQSLGSLAIGSFDHTEIIVLLRMMRTRQLLAGFLGLVRLDTLGLVRLDTSAK